MRTKSFIILLIGSFAASLISCGGKKAKNITISGAFALYPLGVKWTDQYKAGKPGLRFDVSAGGGRQGAHRRSCRRCRHRDVLQAINSC